MKNTLRKVAVGGVVLISTLLLSTRINTSAKTTHMAAPTVSQVTKPAQHHEDKKAVSTVATPASQERTSATSDVAATKSAASQAPQASATSAASSVAVQPQQSSQASSKQSKVSTTDSSSAVLSQFRSQAGYNETDGSRQYMIFPGADGKYQIDVRSQAPDQNVSNLSGVYTYDPATRTITTVDPATGLQH